MDAATRSAIWAVTAVTAFVVVSCSLHLVSAELPAPSRRPSRARLAIRAPVAVKGRAVWYNPGGDLGACGWRNASKEMVASVNPVHFASGGGGGLENATNETLVSCGTCVRVTSPESPNAKQAALVTIVDTCPNCHRDDINLSPAAFQLFFPLERGVFAAAWEPAANCTA